MVAVGLSCGNCLSCGTCEIAADTFTRADNTNISTGIVAPDTVSSWTESSGAWEIASNKLRCTATGIALCDSAHPESLSSMIVQVDFTASSATLVDIIAAWQDSSNYVYGRFYPGGSSAQIYQVVAGATTTIRSVSQSLSTGVTYTGKLCIDGDGLATLYRDGNSIASGTVTAVGDQAGLRAFPLAADFDNFSLLKAVSADDPSCEACEWTSYSCGDCNFPPSYSYDDWLYYVDYGAGGLTDDGCHKCNEQSGELTLGIYTSAGPCSSANGGQFPDGTCTGAWVTLVYLYEDTDSGSDGFGKCFFLVRLALTTDVGPQGWVIYETPATDASITRDNGPWTLSKIPSGLSGTTYRGVSATAIGFSTWPSVPEDWTTNAVCTGTMPSTIGLRYDTT